MSHNFDSNILSMLKQEISKKFSSLTKSYNSLYEQNFFIMLYDFLDFLLIIFLYKKILIKIQNKIKIEYCIAWCLKIILFIMYSFTALYEIIANNKSNSIAAA